MEARTYAYRVWFTTGQGDPLPKKCYTVHTHLGGRDASVEAFRKYVKTIDQTQPGTTWAHVHREDWAEHENGLPIHVTAYRMDYTPRPSSATVAQLRDDNGVA